MRTPAEARASPRECSTCPTLVRLPARALTWGSHLVFAGADMDLISTPAAAALSGAVEAFVTRAGMVHDVHMVRTIPLKSEDVTNVLDDSTPANEDETRSFLLTRSKRTNAPLPKYFIQNPDRKLTQRSAPLAEFVRNGDLRGLRALLFLHAIISNGDGDNGWSTTLPLAVWARVFDTTKTASGRSSSTSATKILTRLVDRDLVSRARTGRARTITVTLLRPDGSGAPFTRPDGKVDKFIKLSNKFWTEGWHEKLDMAATAMLLVALHEKPGFELPTERMPAWYGWSADTAERGLKTLRDAGLLLVDKRIKKAPLSPTGATEVNIYTLGGAFAQGPAGNKKVSPRTPGAPQRAQKAAIWMGSDAESWLTQKYAHIPEIPASYRKPATKRASDRSDKSGMK